MITFELKATEEGGEFITPTSINLLFETRGSLDEYVHCFKAFLYAAQFHPDNINELFNED